MPPLVEDILDKRQPNRLLVQTGGLFYVVLNGVG